MRIVFLAPRFHTNQAILLRMLQEAGHEVHMLCTGSGPTEDHTTIKPRILKQSKLGRLLVPQWDSTKDPSKRQYWIIPSPKELFAIYKSLKPDVAVVRGLTPPYILLSLPILICLGTKIVLYTQSPLVVTRRSIRRTFVDLLVLRILKMDWITPVLHKNGPNASKCDRKDVHPRHHFIPFLVQQADRTFRTPSTSIRFLCIGKFIPRKRILELVRALGAQRSMRQYHLTIIGECSTPEHHQYEQGLNSEIAKQGLEPFVTIVKNLTRAEVSSHFSAADVFVLPSVREPASVSQLEAMAHGLPVICTSDNGTACYIEHGVTGYIVSPDEQSLTEALAKYLNDPGLARLHGDAVTSHFQSFFEPKLLLKYFLYACGDTSK